MPSCRLPHALAAAKLPALTLALLGAAALPAGATGWNEALQGDFSNNGLAPTVVPLAAGTQLVAGSTGRAVAGGPVDRDYFTVTIPAGFVLESMEILPGTASVGDGSFIGLMAGSSFTVPPDTGDASGLLGWTLYGEGNVGSDLLLFMSGPSFGSSGFDVPLAAGTYSFWVQETGVGTATYRFAMTVSAVPEPATALSLLAGLGLLGAALRRR